MSQGDWGEEKKRARPADVLRVSFPGLYPFIFRRTTKATRTRKPGEPRDSEEGEEPLKAESHENQGSYRKESGNYNLLHYVYSYGYLTLKTSPFRHGKGDSPPSTEGVKAEAMKGQRFYGFQ